MLCMTVCRLLLKRPKRQSLPSMKLPGVRDSSNFDLAKARRQREQRQHLAQLHRTIWRW
jgi:hypothetical protein